MFELHVSVMVLSLWLCGFGYYYVLKVNSCFHVLWGCVLVIFWAPSVLCFCLPCSHVSVFPLSLCLCSVCAFPVLLWRSVSQINVFCFASLGLVRFDCSQPCFLVCLISLLLPLYLSLVFSVLSHQCLIPGAVCVFHCVSLCLSLSFPV